MIIRSGGHRTKNTYYGGVNAGGSLDQHHAPFRDLSGDGHESRELARVRNDCIEPRQCRMAIVRRVVLNDTDDSGDDEPRRAPMPTLDRGGLRCGRQPADHLNYSRFTNQVWKNRRDLIPLLALECIAQRARDRRPLILVTECLRLFVDHLIEVTT